MPGRPSLTLARLATLTLVCALSTACGLGSVTVEDYPLEPGTAQRCRAFVDDLPQTVDDAVRRDLDPPIPTAAAWGTPPVVLRCGVPPPSGYRPDAQLFEVDGVAWLPVEGTGGYFFTTVGRVANVEVAVPDRYAPEAQVLTDLAALIRQRLPLTEGRADGATPS